MAYEDEYPDPFPNDNMQSSEPDVQQDADKYEEDIAAPEAQEQRYDEQEQEPGGEDPRQREQPAQQKLKLKKPNIGERLSQVQRQRYQAESEADRLREENARLRIMTEGATQTALQHYDQAVMQRLQAAKDQKIKALESGDIHAQADADVALSLATSEYHNLTNLKAQQQTNEQQQQQAQYQQQYYPEQYNPSYVEPIVRDWASQNTWFIPSSEDYDAEMSHYVHGWCNEFDNTLYRAGRGGEIMTPGYMQLLNEHVHQLRHVLGRNISRGGDLQMSKARTSVSPVRSGSYRNDYTNGATQENRIGLSREEKQFAKSLGVEEKVYLQHKLKDIRDNPEKRGGRR